MKKLLLFLTLILIPLIVFPYADHQEVTGLTNLGAAPASDDEFVVYDTSASTLKSITTANMLSGYYSTGGTDVALADGGTGASLVDPNADRIMFWDDSAGAVTWLTAGTGLSVSTTTLATDDSAIDHDSLLNFEANEHLDWTSDLGATNIHSGNIPDLSGTYQAVDADLQTLATPTNWRVFYSNGTATITELALGASGTYLKSQGASAAPTWDSPSGSGDITDVWGCDTGNCDALTAAGGDTFNAAGADSSTPWKVNAVVSHSSEGQATWESDADLLRIYDGAADVTLALGDSTDGDALAGDSATSFFDTGTIEKERLPDASTTADGVIEVATSAETNTGTDATRAVSPDGLAGSIFGEKVVYIKVLAHDTALETGDGVAKYTIPDTLNGMNLVDADAAVYTASSSGTPTWQIHNLTDTVDMLSTAITIDANELTSYTAATAPVINAANDDVATGDIIRVDCDVAGTGTAGEDIILTFQLP